MDAKALGEFLSTYIDWLNAGRAEEEAVLGARALELAPLLRLVRLLRLALAPVDPPAAFRAELESRLLAAARERPAPEPLKSPSPWRRSLLVPVAAVACLLWLAGLLAFLLRMRRLARYQGTPSLSAVGKAH